jgi:hypothetical protein
VFRYSINGKEDYPCKPSSERGSCRATWLNPHKNPLRFTTTSSPASHCVCNLPAYGPIARVSDETARFALGKVGALQPDEARDRCKQVLGNVAHGRHPLHGLNGEGLTLGEFIKELYVPCVKTNRPRTAANTLEKLKRHFGTWYAEPLSTITADRIESWKIRRVNTGRVRIWQQPALLAPVRSEPAVKYYCTSRSTTAASRRRRSH